MSRWDIATGFTARQSKQWKNEKLKSVSLTSRVQHSKPHYRGNKTFLRSWINQRERRKRSQETGRTKHSRFARGLVSEVKREKPPWVEDPLLHVLIVGVHCAPYSKTWTDCVCSVRSLTGFHWFFSVAGSYWKQGGERWTGKWIFFMQRRK